MELSPKEFETLRNYIHKICGISLTEKKYYLIQQRLEPVLLDNGCSNFSEFCTKIATGGSFQLRDQIIASITTNETSFFRDSHPFEAFNKLMLPKLFDLIRLRKSKEPNRKGHKIRIWSAASSTGQEPYSIAILISEYLLKNKYLGVSREDFGILATDISSEILSQAIEGKYNKVEISRGLSSSLKMKYFREENGQWIINEDIRAMVEFRQINIIQSFLHLGGFDIIFCRNLLIYFDRDTKKKIIEQFAQLLSSEGFLVVGASENLYGLTDGFESKQHGNFIYYKRTEGT